MTLFDRVSDIQACKRGFLHFDSELLVSARQNRNESAQLWLVSHNKHSGHIMSVNLFDEIPQIASGNQSISSQRVINAEVFPYEIRGLLGANQRTGKYEIGFFPGDFEKVSYSLNLSLAQIAQGPIIVLIKRRFDGVAVSKDVETHERVRGALCLF
jgi:hypothetical protein